jgi:hypothetical protein
VGAPLVSIVTPTLNQGAYIEHALRSVRAQSYPNLEHLVIDGGSTDGTLEILRRAADAGTIRWISEPDRGMYDAINKGLAMASGDVLAYLNSDDAYLPWAVETAVAAFEARPDVEVVFGDGVRFDEVAGTQRLRLFPPFDRRSLAHFESVMQPAVFWRRSVLERLGGFDDRLRYVADLDYWLRAAGSAATVLHLDEVVAIERVHGERLSEAHRDAMAAEDRGMRARHQAEVAGGAPADRARAIRRHKAWQRLIWARFLAARLGGRSRGPWRQFRAEGRLTISTWRILAAQLPRGRDRFLPNSVVSGLADEILHGGEAGG